MDATPSGKPGGNGGDDRSHTMAKANGDAREKLIHNMKTVISEAENWLDKASESGAEQARDVEEQFQTTLQTAKTDLMKLEANMLARTKLAAQAADEYVKDNPWKAVSLGAALGVLLGLLASRK